MRLFAMVFFCFFQGLATAAGTEAATPKGQQQCDSRTNGGDHWDVKCPLNASGTAQHFRFKVNFSGGHDDTKANMAPTLDGSPLECEKGSKTSLFGEDGDVSLECRFSITEKAGTQRVFGVTILWSHAQFTDFGLAAD
jgi:hypothetical protein